MGRANSFEERISSIESGVQRRRLLGYVWVILVIAAIPLIFQLYTAYAGTVKALSQAQMTIEADQERLIETDLALSELRQLLGDLSGDLFAARVRLVEADVQLAAVDIYAMQIEALTSRLADARREIAAAQGTLSSPRTVGVDEILRRSLDQRTVYVGDQAEARSDVPISFNCAQMGGPSEILEAVEANSPAGFQLVRLDRVAALPGGMCGHTYYSAVFRLITF